MTQEDYEALKQLNHEELDSIIDESWNWHNSAGEIQVEKYINETNWMRNYEPGEPNFVRQSKGILLPQPYFGVHIMTTELPVKLKHFLRTKFSKKIGWGDTRETWRQILSAAIYDLRELGYVPKPEFHIIIYRFRFNRKEADPDNFLTKLVTDVLRDTFLLGNDSYTDIATITCGKYSKRTGMEIIILPISEAIKYPDLITGIINGRNSISNPTHK